MATYKGTHGTKIQNYTSDPANPLTGQVWFNSTSSSLKVNAGALVASWSTGNNLNAGRQATGNFGIQTAAITTGG